MLLSVAIRAERNRVLDSVLSIQRKRNLVVNFEIGSPVASAIERRRILTALADATSSL